jgi:hypothetical protein
LAVGEFGGGPAGVDEFVVGVAGEGEVADVGVAAVGPGGEVVGLAVVAGGIAAGEGAAAVFGVKQ